MTSIPHLERNVNPALVAQMAQVVGTTITLTGQQPRPGRHHGGECRP